MKRYIGIVFLIIPMLFLMGGCSAKNKNIAQGYIEGRYTYISTPDSGVLKELLVARGTRVKQGDKLLTLELSPEIDTYNSAVNTLKESISARDAIAANLAYYKLTYERYKILVPKQAIQQSLLDEAQSTYNSTSAQLAQANATISANTAAMLQAKWTLDQKVLYAPVDAIVFDTYYRIGEYTQDKTSIISLLAPADIKAIFYVPEPVLSRLQLGQEVWVNCDGCKESYPARISFISPSAEYTPPVIYGNETNPTYIYRLEAEFKPEDAYHLHPGQPVYVKYSQ